METVHSGFDESIGDTNNRFSGEFKDPKKTFSEDEIKGIIKEVVEDTILQDSAYLHSRISIWNAAITLILGTERVSMLPLLVIGMPNSMEAPLTDMTLIACMSSSMFGD
ncbi:5432_t:CDS:2, partial [Acaulospora morrowiae]